jgi:hypothetical protein
VLVGWFHAAQQAVQQGIVMILIRVFLIFMNAEAVSIMGAISGIAGFVVQGLAVSNTVLFLCKAPFSFLYFSDTSFDANHFYTFVIFIQHLLSVLGWHLEFRQCEPLCLKKHQVKVKVCLYLHWLIY